MSKFLSTKEGIIEIPELAPFYKRWICNHEPVEGVNCSSIGLQMISGEQQVIACKKCGKILNERFIPYD